MEDRMPIAERYQYLQRQYPRYLKSIRAERSALLDEMETYTGLNRKTIIRRMHGNGPTRRPRGKQRGRVYDFEFLSCVRTIAQTLDWICAERLQPVLLSTAEHLHSFGELTLNDKLRSQLSTISVSHLHRILKRLRQDEPRLPQKRGVSPSPNAVAAAVPIGIISWRETQPGHFETDTVAHCGPKNSGDYVSTLQMIDVATGWSEREAFLGRSAREVEPALETIRERCPIPWHEIHIDNGPEFLSDHFLRYVGNNSRDTHLSRSRPYQKNDNRFVEQKNYTLVRAYLGSVRLDTSKQCHMLNELYEDMWVYYNFFQPVLRQVERVAHTGPDNVTRIRRIHDTAQTPLSRLLATATLDKETADLLEQIRTSTNPRRLRERIHEKQRRLGQTLIPTDNHHTEVPALAIAGDIIK